MAVRWLWKDKCGKITFARGDKKYTYNLYEGNALLIMLHEWRQDGEKLYQMFNFFADEGHMKRCCGLAKDGYDIFEEMPPVKMRLDISKHRQWKKLTELMLKAYPKMKIELYSKEGKR